MFIITIDSGTTNSRLRLIQSNSLTVADQLKLSVGVRNTAIDGHNTQLKQSIAGGIRVLLSRNSLSVEDVQYIVASGMITSNIGLVEIPHVPAPATVQTFAKHIREQAFEEYPDIPCLYIPGLKNAQDIYEITFGQINQLDVMRGEEAETLGLLKQLNVKGRGIVILPGSHTKFVAVGHRGELTSCLTTLSGEMLQTLSQETILADSLDRQLITELEPDFLLEGFQMGSKLGLTRVVFHIRLQHLFSKLSANQRANYFVGSVLASDIRSLEDFSDREGLDWMIVGGTDPLRKAFVKVLEATNKKNSKGIPIMEATDEQVELCTSIGAIELAQLYFKTRPSRARKG